MTCNAKVVIVAGDVTMDWNLAREPRAKGGVPGSATNAGARACWQRGGAALLGDLIEAIAASLQRDGGAEYVVRQVATPREPMHPGDSRFHHSYAIWSPHKYGVKPPFDKEKPAWRVEEYLGLDRGADDGETDASDAMRVAADSRHADLVVLDDANLGFRNHRGWWPEALRSEGQSQRVLLKTTHPIAQGALWEELQRKHGDRLVVVMTLDDLRQTEVQISRGLSWERTAQDLAWELVHNPRVNGLSQCAGVIVSLGAVGAFFLSRQQAQGGFRGDAPAAPFRLFFDPGMIEGSWEQDFPGAMIGDKACFVAGIARELMLDPDRPDIARGIQSGIAAMRRLHMEGYGDRNASASPVRLSFPIDSIASEVARRGLPVAMAEVEDPVRFLVEERTDGEGAPASGFWTILQDRYRDNLAKVAQQIVVEGAEAALQGVPLGRFGALLTVDRQEIESLRCISALVGEYARQERQKRPLSIAVFGAPGSGKSFGITEMAKSLLPGQIEVLEFNLSQFGAPEELMDALHRVRDNGLSGNIPLVFWDEFDTALAGRPLGWLRYFLAPMQDGAFREGQIMHPIGRAIFVFAGGTSHDIESFGHGLAEDAFRAAKGPDFVSRLKGYVNVLGPNRQMAMRAGRRSTDPHFVIRRAILLRSILMRNAPQLTQRQGGKEVLNVDSGVLRAFLETREYKHGARSMEAIVAMSRLWGKTSFERSSLPAEVQLDLHVDGREFLALVQRMDLEGELLERLAEAAHDVFCEGLRSRGYRWGAQTEEGQKTHRLLKPYAELSEEDKEQNRANVRDIANKLAYAGYVMVPARSDEPPFNFPGDDLETLAEMEHNRWMRARLAEGWRWAPETSKEEKRHNCLLPWHQGSSHRDTAPLPEAEAGAMGEGELPEEEKEKDRDLVRGIPRILARAGYAVVSLHRGAMREPARSAVGENV